jgi:hypothetical protein
MHVRSTMPRDSDETEHQYHIFKSNVFPYHEHEAELSFKEQAMTLRKLPQFPAQKLLCCRSRCFRPPLRPIVLAALSPACILLMVNSRSISARLAIT